MVDYVLHATRILQFDYCNSIVALYKLYCKSGCLSCLDNYRRTVLVQRASQLVSDLWPTMLMRFPVGLGSQFQILPIASHVDCVFTLGNQTLAKSPGGRNRFWQLFGQ